MSRYLILFLLPICVRAEICDHSKKYCGYYKGSSGSSTGAPSRGSKIRINPAAVPTEKGLGLEAILFDGADFALVKGFGRVGAGISPSNSEETFFGPPAVESEFVFEQRKSEQKKYPSQKYSAATAFKLWDNKKSGIKHLEFNLGVLGRYNKLTKKLTGGAGLNGTLGPITFGASRYSDQTRYEDPVAYPVASTYTSEYYVNALSVGLFLNSLALDYSILRMQADTESTTSVVTASLILKFAMFTFSSRREESFRPAYNFDTKSLEYVKNKSEIFYGAQFNVGKYLMAGVFYNYYLLREYSVGATLFF